MRPFEVPKAVAARNGVRSGEIRRRRDALGGCASPATSERVYGPAEAEFLRAVDRYRVAAGLRFVSACDHFRILLDLGYRKPDETNP